MSKSIVKPKTSGASAAFAAFQQKDKEAGGTGK
jgi:hypothetical protein